MVRGTALVVLCLPSTSSEQGRYLRVHGRTQNHRHILEIASFSGTLHNLRHPICQPAHAHRFINLDLVFLDT
jgi:hypothetical protein